MVRSLPECRFSYINEWISLETFSQKVYIVSLPLMERLYKKPEIKEIQ
jgi:hypothetical protein